MAQTMGFDCGDVNLKTYLHKSTLEDKNCVDIATIEEQNILCVLPDSDEDEFTDCFEDHAYAETSLNDQSACFFSIYTSLFQGPVVMNDKSEKIVTKSFLVWNIQKSKEHVSQDRLLRFQNSINEKRGDRVEEHDDIWKDGALQSNDFIILLHMRDSILLEKSAQN